MTLDEFRRSLADAEPPQEIGPALRALWFDARGDWDQAHHVAQEVHDAPGAWVHAYLHRKEGDLGNAAYWYAHSGKPVASGALDDEWAAIAAQLLETTGGRMARGPSG